MSGSNYEEYSQIYGLAVSDNSAEVLARIDSASLEVRPGLLERAMEGAAQRGYIELVQHLLNRGAEVNATGSSQTPLMRAADEGNLETMRLLLDHGADVEITDRWDETALMKAARSGDAQKVSLLLKHGARADCREMNGQSALDLARGVDVRRLLEHVLAGRGPAD